MESMLRISTRETGIDEVELVGTFLEKISLSGESELTNIQVLLTYAF